MQQLLLQNYDMLIASSLLTAIVLILFRPLAAKMSLVDRPKGRKTHKFNTPLTGGISIFLSNILTLLIFDVVLLINLMPYLAGASLMLLLGIIDDKFDLQANTKLFGQIGIIAAYIFSCDCAVTDLGAPLGLTDSLGLGLLSIPFTFLAILGLTNAINMIDGCDGLASSLVICSISALLLLGEKGSNNPNIVFLLLLMVSLLVFLFFNFSNSHKFKIFLGDGGSLFLGFLVSINLVEFAGSNTQYDPSIVLWFVAIPIMDFCAVVVRRLLLKRKITAADRSHIHHYILSKDFSHLQTTILLSGVAFALLIFGIVITSYYLSLSILSFLVLFIIYLSFRVFEVRTN